MVEALSEAYPVKALCDVLQVSRSAYYEYINGQTYCPSPHKAALLKEVKSIFDFHKRRYGSRRIHSELQDKGYEVGRHQVSSLMRAQGLIAIQPKSFVPRTTQGDPSMRRSPNLLLDEDNLPTAPDEVFVGDITYLPSMEEQGKSWLYLAVWMDLFTRKIVGWHVADNMEDTLVITALKKVIYNRSPEAGLIVHSDGGSQYGSNDFRALLSRNQFRQSMSRKDNHYDNAFAESLFSRFKAEVLSEGIFLGLENAHQRCFDYIEGYYNTIRKHSSLGYLSPGQFEEAYWKDFFYRNRLR